MGGAMPATEFHSVYKALKPIIDNVRKVEGIKSGDDVYQIILRAAFVKSYEFNLYTAGLEGHTRAGTFCGYSEGVIIGLNYHIGLSKTNLIAA